MLTPIKFCEVQWMKQSTVAITRDVQESENTQPRCQVTQEGTEKAGEYLESKQERQWVHVGQTCWVMSWKVWEILITFIPHNRKHVTSSLTVRASLSSLFSLQSVRVNTLCNTFYFTEPTLPHPHPFPAYSDQVSFRLPGVNSKSFLVHLGLERCRLLLLWAD